MCENKTASFFKDLLSMWRVWQLFVGNGNVFKSWKSRRNLEIRLFIVFFKIVFQYLDYQYKYRNQGEA